MHRRKYYLAFRWTRVSGSHDLEANGLAEPLDVYPGEYVQWMYQGLAGDWAWRASIGARM